MSKNVWIIGTVSFLTDSATSVITSTLPLFLVYVLKEDVEKLGIIVAIATFVSYALRVLFGYISDRYGVVKPLVVLGYGISAISKPLFYFASSWKEVAFLRSMDRLGKAIRSAPRDTLLSATRGKTGSGRAFGIHKTLDVGGETFGALLASGALLLLGSGEGTFRLLYLLTLFPGLFSLLFLLLVKDVPKPAQRKGFDLERDRELFPFLITVFFVVLFVWDYSFFLVRSKEVGWEIAVIPSFVVLLNLTQLIASYPLGVMIDRFSPELIFRFSVVLALLSMILLKTGFVTLSFLFLGLHLVSFFNSVRSYISERAFNKSTVYGIFYGGYAISGSLGGFLTGVLWNRFGFDIAVNVSIVGLCLLLLLKSFR